MSRLPPQLIMAATRRQIILDYLHGNPGARMPEINAWIAVQGVGGDASNTLRTMAEWQEIRHEGRARSRRYYALVDNTRSAETCKALRYANLSASNQAKRRTAEAEPAPGKEPWRTVNRPGDRPPIPNQGGQGALRRRAHINCGGNHV